MVRDWVEEKEAAATKESSTVPTMGSAVPRKRPGRTPPPGSEIRARYTKKVGSGGDRLLVEGQPMGRAVDLPVLACRTCSMRRGPEPENLDVLQAVNALQHQGFHLGPGWLR